MQVLNPISKHFIITIVIVVIIRIYIIINSSSAHHHQLIMITNSLWLAEQAMCWGKQGRWQNGSQAGARGPEDLE